MLQKMRKKKLNEKAWRSKHVTTINIIIINLNYECLLMMMIIIIIIILFRWAVGSPKVNKGSSATVDTTRACTRF
jgi:hypothetical protein